MDVLPIDYGSKGYIFNALGMIVNTIVILYFIYLKKYFYLFIYGEEEDPEEYYYYENSSVQKSNIRVVKSYISRI